MLRGGRDRRRGRARRVARRGEPGVEVRFRLPDGRRAVARSAGLALDGRTARGVVGTADAHGALHALTRLGARAAASSSTGLEVRRPSLEDVYLELTADAEETRWRRDAARSPCVSSSGSSASSGATARRRSSPSCCRSVLARLRPARAPLERRRPPLRLLLRAGADRHGDRLHDLRRPRDHARDPARHGILKRVRARRCRRPSTSARSRARWRSCSRSRPLIIVAVGSTALGVPAPDAPFELLAARRLRRLRVRRHGVRGRAAGAERRGLIGDDLGHLPAAARALGRVLPAAPAARRACTSSPTLLPLSHLLSALRAAYGGGGLVRRRLRRSARDARLGARRRAGRRAPIRLGAARWELARVSDCGGR